MLAYLTQHASPATARKCLERMHAAESQQEQQQLAFACVFATHTPPKTPKHYTKHMAAYKALLTSDEQKAMRCAKCHSADLLFNLRQTRSADEGSTIYITCSRCQWRRRM